MDTTITDRLTGLVWSKDINCMGSHYPEFDNDANGESTVGDGKVTWQHALDFINAINNYPATYAECGKGYTDWHLPNKKELFSVLDFAGEFGDNHPFINVPSYDWKKRSIWSSTTKANAPHKAYYLIKKNLLLPFRSKYPDYDYYVWAVRIPDSE